MRESKHGAIRCATLQNGWLLMAHNPDPRWIQECGCKHLVVLESHGVIKFDHQTQYFQNNAVAQAATELYKMGIENGGGGFGIPGAISFLTSRGENSGDWVLSHERVTDVLFKALEQPDNLNKLSAEKHSPAVNRHFFVEIDRATHPAAGDSLAEVNPPSETPDLNCRATHIWAVMRTNDEVIAWCGDLAGWKSWKLSVDNSLDGN
ncbi:hypothetical protein [Nitrosomonas sp. Is79A3]|uniref:hypothetical protein n=1 Tax=Nitrosomonas sp. (strain Is79A3) TaxID=261292 RepID=UPI0012E995EB